MAAGVRTRGRMDVDPGVIAQVRRDLVRFFPALEGRRLTHAWGGPIDVSPTHRPAIVGMQGLPAWAAFGFTGNGVAPSHLFGRALAALALDRRDAGHPAPVRRPAAEGGAARAAADRRRRACCGGRSRARRRRRRPAARPTRSRPRLAALPGRIGLHIVR